MKKSLILATSFAMALGVGVAVGAHHAREVEVKAATETTVYYAVSSATVGSYSVKLNVNFKGDGEDWHQFDMSKETATFGGKDVYSGSYTDAYNGVGVMQFQLYDGSTWKSEEVAINSWTTVGNYNGKIWDGEWKTYTPDGGTSHKVDVYVDGVKRGNEDITEGALPGEPAGQYGKYFSGWFDNAECSEGHEVTGVTSTAPVYCKHLSYPTTNYTYSLEKAEKGKFAEVYLYEFDDNGDKAAWPGTKLETTSFSVPTSATVILNAGEGKEQTINVEQLATPVANDVLEVLSTKTGDNYNARWASTVDEPAEDGYYLLGTESSWKFAGSTKIPSVTKDAHNNVAILSNYGGKQEEEIRVRSYKNGVKEWLDCVTTSLAGVGSKVGDNFVFSSAAPVDIYVFDDNGTYKFSVAKHVELLTITVVNRYYIGSAFEKTDAAPSQDCVKGAQFDPIDQSAKDGYVARGYYTDEACTTKFVDNTVVTESTTLYSKYTKVGYYVISEAGNWSIDAAEAMQTTGIAASNKAEIHLSVLQNECYSFVEYIDNGTLDGLMDGQNGLGEGVPNTLAVYEDNHVKFVKDASVHVYFGNDDLIYLNEGLTAFLTNFISDVGGVCSTLEGPGYEEATYISNLQAAWARQKNLFNALNPETEQKVIIDAGYDAPVSEEALNQMIAKYRYIVDKYGTDICEDFIWGETRAPKVGNNVMLLNNSNNTGLIIIISVSAISVISIAAFLMLKKRKEK